MSLLNKLGTGQGYLKAGLQGFAGSGKTFTAMELAIGTRALFDLKTPIAMLDTEGGSEYIAERVRQKTGQDLVGLRTMAFSDLINLTKECEKEKISVLVVDSISHIWKELQDSHLAAVNQNRRRRNLPARYNLEFQDWGPLKLKWAEWTTLFLNSRLHIIFCGRAAFTYDQEKNEETGKKELTKTGTKMRAESEFGYEPSLLIEMEQIRLGAKGKIVNRATVLKDRFDAFCGQSFDNPTFESFRAHVERLKPGAYAPIDTSLKTEPLVDDEGNDDRRRRAILLEEIENELVLAYPGQTKEEKTAKINVLRDAFNTAAWTAIQGFSADRLREGLARIRQALTPPTAPEVQLEAAAEGK